MVISESSPVITSYHDFFKKPDFNILELAITEQFYNSDLGSDYKGKTDYTM